MEEKFIVFSPLSRGKKFRKEYDSAAKAIAVFRDCIAKRKYHNCFLNKVEADGDTRGVIAYTPVLRSDATHGYVEPRYSLGVAITSILGE